jgi:nicotinamide-nucleotide amidase
VNPPLLSKKELLAPILCGQVADLMLQKGWLLATAESCTGGLISAACTDLAGSSNWFERGFVTYSNAAKSELLGVDAALIAAHGAVSDAVVCAMVQGAITHSKAQVAVAVTGVSWPYRRQPHQTCRHSLVRLHGRRPAQQRDAAFWR